MSNENITALSKESSEKAKSAFKSMDDRIAKLYLLVLEAQHNARGWRRFLYWCR
jgi:hypothetical protein